MQSNRFDFRDDTQKSRTQKTYQASVKKDSQNENSYSKKSTHEKNYNDYDDYNDYEKNLDYNYDDSK